MSHFIKFSDQKEKILFPGITARITHSDQVTITRVSLEKGAVLPEHQHINEQWSTLIEGELEMEVDGERQVVREGMTVFIPSDAPHSAIARTHCVVIDMFVPKRNDL